MAWIASEESAKALVEFALTHLDEEYFVSLALKVLNGLSIPAAPVFEVALRGKKPYDRSIAKLIKVCADHGELACVVLFRRHQLDRMISGGARAPAVTPEPCNLADGLRNFLSEIPPDAQAPDRKATHAVAGDTSRHEDRPIKLALTATDEVAARLVLRQPLFKEDVPVLVSFIVGTSQNLCNFATWRFRELGQHGVYGILKAFDECPAYGENEDLRKLLMDLAKHIIDGALLVTLLARASNESVRMSLRIAIKKIAPQAAQPLLDQFLEDSRIREREGPLLAQVCGREALPVLLDALQDESPSVRESAEDGLALLGRGARLGDMVVDSLLDSFVASTSFARESIIHILIRIEPARAGLSFFLDAIRDESPLVRDAAGEGLVLLGHISVDPLIDLLTASASPRESIIRVLTRIGPGRAAQLILDVAKYGPLAEKRTAIEALGFFASQEAYALVFEAAFSADLDLALSAVKALSQWRGTNVVEALEALAKDGNESVSKASIQALEEIASGDAETRTEIAQALFRIFVDQAPPSSDWALDALLSIEDPTNLRRAARDSSVQLGEKKQQLLLALFVHEAVKEQAEKESGTGLEGLELHTTVGPPFGEPSAKAPAVQKPITDAVHFSVTAPGLVRPGIPFLLDVWAHLDRERSKVLRRAREEAPTRKLEIRTKGPVAVERKKTLQVRLDIPSFGVSDVDSIFWDGKLSNASFLVATPSEALIGEHFGMVRFYVEQLIGRLYFTLRVGTFEGGVEDRTTREERLTKAFASYATEDRSAVLARIQGMQKVLPSMDIFMDVMSLRSGDNWEHRVEEEIMARDIFYLFWSSAASRSPWVEREWRIALDRKGIDSIDPVPLEPPDKVPPPVELSVLHFNEWILAYSK